MTTGPDTRVTKAAIVTGSATGIGALLVIDSGEHMAGGIAPGDG